MKAITTKFSIFYFLIICCVLVLKMIDFEFNISWASFFTFCFFAGVVLLLFIYYEYSSHKKETARKQVLLEQIKKQQFIPIDEVADDDYLKALLLQNQDLQNNFLRLNEQQIKWIHDIKIPLATLQLFNQNNKATLSYENRKTLDLIALNFDQLIEQKLMLDKVINDIDDMIIETINLSESIVPIIKKLAPLIQFKKIKLALAVDKHLQVVSDKKSLRYCFEQIITNAIKYTQEEGTITIKTVVDANTVTLFFIDDGMGIDSQDINHIFEYGYTGKNGINNTKNASSGVGLFMVKQTLTRLHHDITVLSPKETIGTIVKIKF